MGGAPARSGGVRLDHPQVTPVVPTLRALVARKPGPLDLHWFEWVNRRRTHPLLDWLLPRLTLLGLGGVQLPAVGLVWWLNRGSANGRALWWQTLLVFAFTTIAVHLVKRRVKRKRPVAHLEVRFLVPVTRAGSFPSGHTATTFALATVVAWHFPHWAAPVFLLAVLVGYSRVYVGVHFVSDVVAAALIGTASAALICSAV
jgi:undecaprenyl-diphosphatase